MSARVYLDWNATTPPLASVLDAMRTAAEQTWGNPASIHTDGRAARAVVEDARTAVARIAGGDARDVLFTSGGTEANNLALRSFFPTASSRWLLTSRIEHPSVARVAEALEREGRARVRWVRVTATGTLDLDDLKAACADAGAGAVVTVQAVNHETGIMQPVAEVVQMARSAGARVHVDAIQAWGKVSTDGLRGAETMSIAAHKFRGPKGIGALVTRPGARVLPLLLGGGQEKGLRPGTVDPALAAGFGVASEAALDGYVRYAPIAARRDALEAALLGLGDARVVGDPALRVPHVSTLVWPGWVGAELVAALDLEGVSVSSGAACSAGTVEPSPVIAAVLGDAFAASSVRVSLGEATTDDDVARAIAAFRRVLSRSSPYPS
jgi:cysteine desulfurase